LGALLGPPIFLAIVAALRLAIVNGLFGVQLNFKKSFSVACYANLVSMLGVVMGVAMILFGDPERFNPNNPISSNIGFFLNPLETSKPLLAMASSLDIFSFWLIALLGIATGIGLAVLLSFNLLHSDDVSNIDMSFIIPWWEILLTAAFAYLATFLMTLLPSRQASSIVIAEAIRYE